MDKMIWLAPLFAAAALLFALYKARYVSKCDAGNSRMQEIAAAIAEGASAFLRAEYKILAIFIVVLFALITIFIDFGTAVCFVIGACFSILAGFFGMRVATKANVRTANAALTSGMNKALSVASFCCSFPLRFMLPSFTLCNNLSSFPFALITNASTTLLFSL